MSLRTFSRMAGLTALLSAAAPYSALAGTGGNLTQEEIERIKQNYGPNASTNTAPIPPPYVPSEPAPQAVEEQPAMVEEAVQAPPEPAPFVVEEQPAVEEPVAQQVLQEQAIAPETTLEQPQAELSPPPLPAPSLAPQDAYTPAVEQESPLQLEVVSREPRVVESSNYSIPLSLSPLVRGYSFSGKDVGGFAVGYGGEAGLHLTENLRLTIAGGVLSRINDARYSGPTGTENNWTIGSEDELGYADQVLQTDRLRNTDSYDGFADAAISYDLGTALIDKDFTLSLGLFAGVLTGQRDLETRTSQLLQTTKDGETVYSQRTAEAIQTASQGTHLSPTAQLRLSLGYAPIGLEASFAAGVFDLSLAHPNQSRDLYTAEVKADLVKIIEAI